MQPETLLDLSSYVYGCLVALRRDTFISCAYSISKIAVALYYRYMSTLHTRIATMTSNSNLYIVLMALIVGLHLQCSFAFEEILNPFTTNNGNNNNNNNSGSGCRLIIEKNEWDSGCIPAVNFVVKLVDCGEGTAM